MKPDRWFYLDGLEANEFEPLYPYRPIWGVWGAPPNWCRVHYEDGDDLPTIEAPCGGDYHWYALDRVAEHL